MQLANLRKVKKYYGDRIILDIDKFEINEGDRVGLIGENGAGKTTLIKVLLKEVKVDEGNVHLTDSFSYINQGNEFKEENFIKGKNLFNLNEEYKGFLSGGEKLKIKINNALYKNKKLIIADEPTSNLDEKSIRELEEWFKKYRGAIFLVSHDRDFLDSICNIIVELEDGKIKIYKGNYSKYLILKNQERDREKFEYEDYINKKKHIEKAIIGKQNLRDSLRKTPKRMGNSEARLHKMGPQRAKKNIEKNINALKSRIENLEVKEKPKNIVDIKVKVQNNLEIYSKNLIETKDYGLKIDEKVLIQNGKFKVKNGKKIALIGENGVGKTTLIKKIISKDENLNISKNIVIGYFDQGQENLKEDRSILENIMKSSSYDETFIRINLNRFGFYGDVVLKKVECLSGGEKVKVSLCKTLLSDNNLIILDEPTNYLDIKTKEALEEALINCSKTCLIISHDRRFIENICNYIIEIKDKEIIEFDGTYTEYNNRKNEVKVDNKERESKENILVLENKLSNIISLLSIEVDLNKKENLEKEYFEIIKELKKYKNK
ncbi:ABC-F type ribosomal protection protein CplR [uncultured Clostridium sp.]|uniref:ABC-F type ribosomal protection protein CplR n=1 Tax=uncultured Clostridium sp. TaxID=59620 RepID=UPI0026143EEB|nr:ABC-F type ribosomal protection protein CplR [uncultured Clostridium sp.]